MGRNTTRRCSSSKKRGSNFFELFFGIRARRRQAQVDSRRTARPPRQVHPRDRNAGWYDDDLSTYNTDSNSAFRLIQLYPGQSRGPIECEMRLDRFPPIQPDGRAYHYEALSYCWGDQLKCREIVVNGRPGFQVTVNLYNALQRLRRATIPRALWVDAICIDQSNDAERNCQIQLMREIYSTASRVNIWLGSADQFRHSNRNFDTHNNRGRTAGRYYVPLGDTPIAHYIQRDVDSESTCPNWWDRTWIIQELLSAQSAWVYLGVHEIEWRIFNREFYNSQLHHLSELQQLVDRYPEPPSLYELMRHSSKMQATDPKDKVYALLGLANQRFQTCSVDPNYGKSLQDLAEEVTSEVLETTRNLQIVCDGWKSGDDVAIDWPTWLPYLFSACDARIPPSPCFRRLRWKRYSIGQDPELDETRVLVVQGEAFDEIADVRGEGLRRRSRHKPPERSFFGLMSAQSRRHAAQEPSSTYQEQPRFFQWQGTRVECSEALAGKLKAWCQRSQEEEPVLLPNQNVTTAIPARFVFYTRDWRIGITRKAVHREDKIVALHGSRVPIVLRQVSRYHHIIIDSVLLAGEPWSSRSHGPERGHECDCERFRMM